MPCLTPLDRRPRSRAVTSGELPRPVWASQAIDLITSLRPAADVVDGIAAQAQDALARALGR